MDEEPTKEPSHNNPEEAADYLKAVNNLLDKFVNDVRGFNPYACRDAYKNFVHTLSQLLSKLDSTYFTHMNTQLVLDTIPDKECVAFLEFPVQLSKVSSPEQFTFVLKLAVRPTIQLRIPPHLSAPTDLKFEKERLTQEETVEEYCCNLILPQPFHPKLSGIPLKHPTRCLAAAAHFLIRKKLFNSKYPQLQVAKDFAVSFQFVYFQKTPPPYQELVLTHCKHHQLFRSWHNATTKFNHHNIHNSFGNSVIQSAYQPSIYSRLN